MAEDIFDESNDSFMNDAGANNRPVFLLILCVLSWMAVTSNVYSALSAMLAPNEVTTQLEATVEMLEDTEGITEGMLDDFREYTTTIVNNFKAINVTNLILYLLEGFGVLMMFNMRRIGFWIYVACQLGLIASVFAFYPSDNFVTSMLLGYFVFSSSLFTLLYGSNLKYLK